MKLAGQVALVTGASRGIGRAVALALGAGGCGRGAGRPVVAGGRRRRAKELAGLGADALALPADVTRERRRGRRWWPRTLGRFGRIDVLVTAAGTAAFAPVAELDIADWDRLLAVNLRGAVLCCRAVLPSMMAQRRGTIINIGSVVTSRTLPGTAAYTASKYALLGFSRVLAEEMRAHGVRVGVLAAGATDTPLWDTLAGGPDRARMLTPRPGGRGGAPDGGARPQCRARGAHPAACGGRPLTVTGSAAARALAEPRPPARHGGRSDILETLIRHFPREDSR